MGQASSSSIAAGKKKRTPHEVLEVPEGATLEEITKQYRKLARRYHPDSSEGRAMGIDPEAFSDINNAFSELKRLHEHKPEKSSAMKQKREDTDIDIAYYIKLAKGIEVIKEGDYTRINEVFSEIVKLESLTRSSTYRPPTFGYAKGNPEPFYRYYEHFSSLRHFNITPCTVSMHYDSFARAERRAVEAEVRNRVQRKRQEYTERVRELARILHGKDPRVSAPKKQSGPAISKPKIIHKGEELKETRGLTLEEREALEEEYRKYMQDSEIPLPPQRKRGEKKTSTQDRDVYACPPCSKTFKTLNQLDNHVVSNKHREKAGSLSKEEQQELHEALQKYHANAKTQDDDVLKGRKMHRPTAGGDKKQEDKVPDKVPDTKNAEITLDTPKPPVLPQHKPAKKKSKRPAVRETRSVSKPQLQKKDTRPGSSFALSCAKCKEVFETRNQLFAHLKETGHSTPLG